MSNRINFINHFVRWILPLLVVLLIALYLVLSTAAFTHAAAPTTRHHVATPHTSAPKVSPHMYWPLN